MPTVETYIIDPDNRAGTDYTSLDAFLTAKNSGRNLVTEDVLVRGLLRTSTTASGSALTISGATTDTTRYLELAAAPGYELTDTINTGLHHWFTNSTATQGLTVSQANTRLSGLQIRSKRVTMFFSSTGLVEKCVIIADSATSGSNIIEVNNPSGVVNVRNNVILAVGTFTTTNRGVLKTGASATLNLDNNTIIRSGSGGTQVGIQASAGQIPARNNILYGWGTPYGGTLSAGTDYNATDAAATPGVGSNNLQSQSFSFVDAGNHRYALTNSLAGLDLSGTFTDDFLGVVRPQRAGFFDIGAFELLEPTASAFPQVMIY